MKNMRIVVMVVMFAGLALVVSGCTMKQGGGETVSAAEEISLTCIAVLPVVSAQEHSDPLTPIDRKSLAGGVQVLDRLLNDQLYDSAGVRFIAQGRFPEISHDRGAGFLSMAGEVASQAGCNGVLAVTLHHYRERVGGPYAAEKPASVSFSWRLVEVNSGTVLCYGRYDETQEGVLENLLYLVKAGKRGFTWVAADRLLADGLESQFAGCSFFDIDK
jgi:hypothetical protein